MSPVLSLAYLLVSVARASAQAADTEHVYSEDQLTAAPLVLRQPPTEYPDSLRRRGIGGPVRVSAVLDAKGRPDPGSVRVVSTPDTALNGLARAVVAGTHFAPGRMEQRAVRAQIVVSVEFDPAKAATAPDPIYGDDSLSEKPAVLFGPPVDYPEDLRRKGVQGRVVIRAVLDTLGRIEPASIQFLTTPDPGFLMSVGQYLTWARFRPARRNGRAVRAIVTIPVDFRLRGVAFPCPVGGDLHLPCRP